MSGSNTNKKSVVVGSLLGVIIGATTALFVSPKSGKRNRKDFKNQMSTIQDQVYKIADRTKEKVSDVSQSITKNA